jgi:hypothetical protein
VSKPTQDEERRRQRIIRALRCLEDELLREPPDPPTPNAPTWRVPRELWGHTLRLPAKLAAILDLLKAKGSMNAEQLLEALGDEFGGAHPRRSLSQAVYRLNQEIEASGLGRRAIRSCRNGGYGLRPARREDHG